MSAPSPEPRAWAVGASYWGARESVPYMLREEAEPLYDAAALAAALAAARRQALEDAARVCEALIDGRFPSAIELDEKLQEAAAAIRARMEKP